MDVNSFLEPVQKIIDWMRTYQINLYGFQFTFMDFYLFQMLAIIVIGFIKSLNDD